MLAGSWGRERGQGDLLGGGGSREVETTDVTFKELGLLLAIKAL